jgi:hypothetical protein
MHQLNSMSLFRSLVSLTGVALTLTLLNGCNGDRAKEPEAVPAKDSATATQAKSPMSPSVLPPGPTLPAASADLGADTIPLRAPDGGPARYGLASGRIVQEYRGGMKGKRVILFDHYGMRERREDNSAPEPPGKPGPIQNSIFISRQDTFGRVELRDRSGWKMKNSAIQHYLSSDSSHTMSLGDIIMTKTPGQRLADTTINGYHCKVVLNQQPGIIHTVWVWRGITLREHFIAPMDSMEFWVETIELQPNLSAPDSAFRFPAGITMQEVPEPKPGQTFMPPMGPQQPGATPPAGGPPPAGMTPTVPVPGRPPQSTPIPPMPNPK